MIRKATVLSGVYLVLALSEASATRAQDPALKDQRSEAAPEASGTFAPDGRPVEPPTRVGAGGSCIIDLEQPYTIRGTLSGSLDIDYRILVHGPCEVPPDPGKHEERWIAHGVFEGTIDGAEASGTLTYMARVRAGGDVEGRMVFGGGIDGELEIAGNFSDGKLSYRGRLARVGSDSN